MEDKKFNLAEKQISSKEVFNGSLLHVYSDQVKLKNGKSATREYIKHKGAVCIVPVDDEGNVYIEHQFRYPFHKTIIELPAGKLDSFEEDHLEAAKRELLEETGLTASSWSLLGEYTPSPAYTDEVIYIYIAKGLTQGKQDLDEDEFLEVEKIPFKQLLEMVKTGVIKDGKTQVAVCLAAWRLYE